MISFPERVLKCECNICEESQNNTCITDGLCFTEIHNNNGEISYTYRMSLVVLLYLFLGLRAELNKVGIIEQNDSLKSNVEKHIMALCSPPRRAIPHLIRCSKWRHF
ncbi:hypothetical protein TNCT_517341 [Trichonephila clavata]|uniref:Uncharacterized protein n=1 Tax=Trichonephila clavata TaxID=2740835 RepID=A0A8X6GBN9_TRICU|nr:hypothetical protein TNCT_517341 [Trichonephila clavata]